ncbi:MAG: thiamine phosphate synthase [Phycisphaeraceae bacterium]
MPSVLRILDANANRAREALRVMEEAARFILDDEKLMRRLKELRHDLATTMCGVPGLEANRDTTGDVGTTVSTPTEQSRESVVDVAIAAGKRLSEALRSIEEYGKTLGDRVGPSGFASAIEKLRYRGYILEQNLTQALGTGRARQWRLCVLLTESLCTQRSWKDVLAAALDGGADCIQLREKELDAGWLMERASFIVEQCRSRASVIINDRPDIALLSGADGVHLGQTDLSVAHVRRLAGKQLLIGVSTSNLSQAKRALAEGADYCGVGPMFATTTKHKPVLAGPDYLRQYLEWNRLPHLAIGGITAENLPELVAAGVQGIAVSSSVCGAADPAAVVRKMLEHLPENLTSVKDRTDKDDAVFDGGDARARHREPLTGQEGFTP